MSTGLFDEGVRYEPAPARGEAESGDQRDPDCDFDTLRRRVRASEALCEASQHLLSAAHGEEHAQAAQALDALALTLDADRSRHLHLNRRRDRRSADRAHPSQQPQADRHGDEQQLRSRIAAVVATAQDNPTCFQVTVPSPTADQVVHWAVAPIGEHGSIETALCLGRTGGPRWERWELSVLCSLADVLPHVRRWLATEAQLAAMFHNAPTGITLRDHEGNLVDCNQAFLDFVGLASEVPMLGTGPWELLASEALTDDFFEHSQQWDRTGVKGLELPYRHQTTGHVVWGRVSASMLVDDDSGLWITHVEDVTADVLARIATEARAARDALTGLANRHHLFDVLRELLANAAAADPAASPSPRSERSGDSLPPCTVVLLDLDAFKPVNDTFGHGAGDGLLIEVGRRLSQAVRHQDLVGRYGGDEFLIVLGSPLTPRQLEAITARIQAVFDREFTVSGHVVEMRASIGLASATAGDSPAELIARADAAMYADKRRRTRPGAPTFVLG